MHVNVNMAFDLLRKRRRQNSKTIAAQLCMIIACLDDEGKGIRKKRPDRDWLRRRAVRGAYAGIVTELAGLFFNERAALETNH